MALQLNSTFRDALFSFAPAALGGRLRSHRDHDIGVSVARFEVARGKALLIFFVAGVHVPMWFATECVLL